MLMALTVAASLVHAAMPQCRFCVNASSRSISFDLTSLPNGTFDARDSRPAGGSHYYISSPCRNAALPDCPSTSPVSQSCRGLGSLNNVSVKPKEQNRGFNITLFGGSDNPPCGHTGNRTLVYNFICDRSVPASNPPEPSVVEKPACTYTVTWRHASACDSTIGPADSCAAAAPPAPPVTPCTTCLPTWKPTVLPMRTRIFLDPLS